MKDFFQINTPKEYSAGLAGIREANDDDETETFGDPCSRWNCDLIEEHYHPPLKEEKIEMCPKCGHGLKKDCFYCKNRELRDNFPHKTNCKKCGEKEYRTLLFDFNGLCYYCFYKKERDTHLILK